jgi:CRISPR system Cascade subunit CasE
MSESLYLTRIALQGRAAMEFARARGLAVAGADPGYLLHSVLREAFQDDAPQPFALTRGAADSDRPPRRRAASGGRWELLAYGSRDAQGLRERLERFAAPEVYRVVDAGALACKPMPGQWPPGLRLGFETRVCPVVRHAGRGGAAPREQDAFLAAVQGVAQDAPVEREAVYREWLGRELARDGAARLEQARMAAFRRTRLERRGHSRAPGKLERPDVTFHGELTVTDSDAFGALLRRGLGRHRAFGFGMLLVRPARGETP